MKPILSLVLGLLMISGCGGEAPLAGDQPTFSGRAIKWLEGDCALDKEKMEGSCSFVFVQKSSDSHHYSLNFDLERGSSLTLIAHANDRGEYGMEVKISRSQLDKWIFEVTAQGTTYDFSDEFTGLSLQGQQTLGIDIHGDHGHIVYWVAAQEIGEHTLPVEYVAGYWGLQLENATVTQAQIGSPKDEH